MLELLGTIFGGGATGLIGSTVGRFIGIWESKQKTKQLQIELQHEILLQKLNIEARSNELESEERIAESVASSQMMNASYSHDTGYGTSFLRWVRPLLTIMLIGLTSAVYWTSENVDTKDKIALQVVYLTITAVSWWFADRSGKNRN